jgi:hypothetical protein
MPRRLLLFLDGEIRRQRRIDGPSGSYPTTWEVVSTDTLPGRATQVLVRPTGQLVVVTASSEIYELASGNGFGTPPRWKLIEQETF